MLLREGSSPACHHSFRDIFQRVKERIKLPCRGDRVVLLARFPQNNSRRILEKG
jgi:hypothetical protein